MAQRLEAMLLDALLLQGSEEALHEPVLFRCIRRREFLGETIGFAVAVYFRLLKTRPLSERNASGC